MRFHFPHLFAHIRLQIIEGIEVRRLACDRAHLIGQVRSQLVLLHVEQPAVGVVDDDELLRVEQVVRHNQRPQRVFRGNAAGVADHVRVSGVQTQAALEENARVHAGQHGHAAARLDGQISKVEVLYEFLVGFQQFVCD